MRPGDELRGGFDVAIRRGSAEQDSWPQYRAIPILAEADTLIMSPALFDRQPVRHATDLARHVLLVTETRPGDWTDWLDQAGLQSMAEPRRRVFDHFFVTVQAVMDGLGLGIGPMPVLEADVAAGRLLTPLPAIAVARRGYVALIPFDADKTTSLARFIKWLRTEGAG